MSLRRRLLQVYWAMERRIVPGLEYSQHEYEKRLLERIPHGARWLDLGCGRRLLPEWRSASERTLVQRPSQFVGIDVDLDSLHDNKVAHYKVFGVAQHLPFAPESFDVVTANMVVEHLEDPAGTFREVRRVLSPGGLFFFHTPNSAAFPTALSRRLPDPLKRGAARILDGRSGKDVFHTYYRANTAGDVTRLAQASGLSIVEISLVSSTALFSIVPPLAFLELLYLRSLRSEERRERRSNLIAVLSRGEGAGAFTG